MTSGRLWGSQPVERSPRTALQKAGLTAPGLALQLWEARSAPTEGPAIIARLAPAVIASHAKPFRQDFFEISRFVMGAPFCWRRGRRKG